MIVSLAQRAVALSVLAANKTRFTEEREKAIGLKENRKPNENGTESEDGGGAPAEAARCVMMQLVVSQRPATPQKEQAGADSLHLHFHDEVAGMPVSRERGRKTLWERRAGPSSRWDCVCLL